VYSGTVEDANPLPHNVTDTIMLCLFKEVEFPSSLYMNCPFDRSANINLDPVYMEWGTPV